MNRYSASKRYFPLGENSGCVEYQHIHFLAEDNEMAVKIACNWVARNETIHDICNVIIKRYYDWDNNFNYTGVCMYEYITFKRNRATPNKGFKWKIKNFDIANYWI